MADATKGGLKMADEYIRLDTTIMGINGLINEAPTGSQARALFCVKDMIYDQQRYVSEMKPVKRGRWIFTEKLILGNPYGSYKCSECMYHVPYEDNYCPNCGADMRGEENG